VEVTELRAFKESVEVHHKTEEAPAFLRAALDILPR
jgi:hypothetical protein